MIDVYFYGTLKELLKHSHLKIDAKSVKDLIKNIESNTGVKCQKELMNALTFVNEVNFLSLKRYKTPLSKGDKVAFLSPASGG